MMPQDWIILEDDIIAFELSFIPKAQTYKFQTIILRCVKFAATGHNRGGRR